MNTQEEQFRGILSHAFLGEDENISKQSFDLAIKGCVDLLSKEISERDEEIKRLQLDAAIGFLDFLLDSKFEVSGNSIWINNNPHGIKSGYYTKEHLYEKFKDNQL